MASEIAYNVEHVFNENSREVRKMPIKMGEETLWVDCVDQVKIWIKHLFLYTGIR